MTTKGSRRALWDDVPRKGRMWSIAAGVGPLALAILTATSAARGEAPRIRLRGAMHVDTKVTRTTGKLLICTFPW